MTELGERTYDNLLAEGPYVTQPEIILSGQNVVRGSVMGRVTASGKLKIVDSGNSDGSESPWSVMAEDVDASAADVEGITYHTGSFNKEALAFGSIDTFSTHMVAMRQLNMHGVGSASVLGTIS